MKVKVRAKRSFMAEIMAWVKIERSFKTEIKMRMKTKENSTVRT